MWENLIAKIKAIMEANTLVQETYDYEIEKFEGQPSAVIVPSDNSGEFTTTTDNERVYAFSVFLFVARGDDYYTDKTADIVMRELVDSVLDDFDKNWRLTGLTLSTGYSMLYMEAAPSSWGYVDREMVYRMAEITLRIHLDVDTSLIS